MKSFVFINLLVVLRFSFNVLSSTTKGQSIGDLVLKDYSHIAGGSSGRLEVYYNGQWGTVCNDSFDGNDAIVACRQLGFPNYSTFGRVDSLGFSQALSSTRIWLDNLHCSGLESRLIDCPANAIGVEDCTHSQDVALICSSENILHGDLRLVSTISSTTGGSSGRLEVYYNGKWGTICDSFFDANAARVACHQLGYSTYSQYGTVGALGFNRPPYYTRIWLEDFVCSGSESRLIDCPASTTGLKVETCSHYHLFDEHCDPSHFQDIALICSETRSNGDLRLVKTPTTIGGSSGRLEFYYNGLWGTVCDNSFDESDARVACRQLGFTTFYRYGTVRALGFSQASSSTRIWLDNLHCSGSENRLIDCSTNTIGVVKCTHSEDIALICSGRPSSGDLRLIGTTGAPSGRLEVYYSGQWGTVCDDSFDANDARVACHQLGFSTYSHIGRVGSLGFSQASSSTRIWLNNLHCSGSESRLINCPANEIGNENCDHSEDVALICTTQSGDLRLVNNSGDTGGSSGRLEIYYNGQWGTLTLACYTLADFYSTDARVACRQLGFSDYSAYGTVGNLGFNEASSSTPTWLDSYFCHESESRLTDCSSGFGHQHDHVRDVALICTTESRSNGNLRLVNNSATVGGSSGRLEVYYSGQWGTVCDDNFDVSDARVACRQLGFTNYSQYGRVGLLGFSEASSFTRIWLDNLRCSGSESELINCPANSIGVEDCTHSQDIAIICSGSPSSGDLRLASNSTTSGRLEVYYNGTWGTVCNDNFDGNDARVACGQLGFSDYTRYGSVGLLGISQASPSTPTWFVDELLCSGSESRQTNCSANIFGDEDCSHSDDIALICGGDSTTSLPSTIIGGVAGSIIFFFIAIVIFVVTVIGRYRRRRSRVRYHQVPNVQRPVSTAVTVAQTSATANSQAIAMHSLQHPANPVPYPSEPRITAPIIKGEPGESKNLELCSNAPPPAYRPELDYPSISPPVAMDTGNDYPGQ